MAKLTAKKRNALPKKDFGLPAQGKYPMPDKSHAANAKARATQMVKQGKLAPAAKSKIDAKANRMLGEGSPADKRQDAAMAKSKGTTMAKIEGSKADEAKDKARMKRLSKANL